MHPFEKALSVSTDQVEIDQPGRTLQANSIFSPRRLRGSDFLIRQLRDAWSEERLAQAVNEGDEFYALPYGLGGTAPDEDVRAFELYFERLEQARIGKLKRPDLLIFRKRDETTVAQIVEELGGIQELPFTLEDKTEMQEILARSIIAVKCENSLCKASLMPDYGSMLKPQKRLDGKLGLKKTVVLPTIIIKDEDRNSLREWQSRRGIEIHIWQVFYDLAWGIAFDKAENLIADGFILSKGQVFQSPSGTITRKPIYHFYYHYGYPLGESREEPSWVADKVVYDDGQIIPYVKLKGGKMALKQEAIEVLRISSRAKNGDALSCQR